MVNITFLEKNDSKYNLNFEEEVKNELERLKNLIPSALVELEMLDAEIKILEQKISDYLKIYYRELHEFVRQLPKNSLKDEDSELSYYVGFAEEEQYLINSITEQTAELISEKTKQLFRKLVKLYHPDIASNQNLFDKLNHAYNDKNLYELIRIDLDSDFCKGQESIIDQFDRLNTEYDSLILAIAQRKQKKDEILNSKEYNLYKKSIKARILGKDLIECIKENIIARIGNFEEV